MNIAKIGNIKYFFHCRFVDYMEETILVICVDRDNDLGKIKKVGPIVGKRENLEAAKKLLMKDPEETDGNTIFHAVKVYDKLKSKKTKVEIATLTGDEKLGYNADRKITKQLEKVLKSFPADSCIFVSDGAEDDAIIPIISSRIKISSKETVTVKQAKELEKTYFTLLSKLKEPYYARLIFGIPGIILLAYIISAYLGFGWRPIIAIVGIYLLIKGIGIEESLISWFKGLFFVGKAAFVFYLPIIALLVIGVSLGFTEYNKKITEGLTVEGSAFYGVRLFLLIFTFVILLTFIGKIIQLYSEGLKFEMISSAHSAINWIAVTFVGYVTCSWLYPYGSSFAEFLTAILISITIAFFGLKFEELMKKNIINKLELENKDVIDEEGGYIGKVLGIDRKKDLIFVTTPYGSKINLKITSIINVEEKVTIRK